MTIEETKSWIIDHWGNDLEDGTKQSEVVKICLSALSENKCFEGMTHRDVLKTLFPIDENKGARLTKVYIDHEPIESFALTTTQKWLDSLYKGVSE